MAIGVPGKSEGFWDYNPSKTSIFLKKTSIFFKKCQFFSENISFGETKSDHYFYQFITQLMLFS